MTTAIEKKINPAVLARWREQVADFTTGVERVGNTVFVFYLVEGDGLAVRVLGNTTVHLYEATNTQCLDYCGGEFDDGARPTISLRTTPTRPWGRVLAS